jgi:MarR family 2-MHQ and catechol resistance regulon transcriptional repressor
MNQQERNELDLKLFRTWAKASKSVFKNIRKDIEGYNITPENFMILELLYSKGPHPVQKISDTLSIPSGSITYEVDKLEKKGLVERQASATDRRGSNVLLTEEGTTLFNDIFPRHLSTISQNLSFISDEEKELLTELLKKSDWAQKIYK